MLDASGSRRRAGERLPVAHRDNRSIGIKQIFTDFARSSFSAVALPSPRQRHRIILKHKLEGYGMAPDGAVAYREWDHVSVDSRAVDDFPAKMTAMVEQHRPSRMPFFRRVAALPFAIASDP